MVIDVELEVLSSVKSGTREVSEQIGNSANRIGQISESISASWQSKSSGEFISAIEDVKGNLINISVELEQLSTLVGKYAETVREIERINSQRLNNMGHSGSGHSSGGGFRG